MRIVYTILLLSSMILASIQMHGQTGCIDNSKHLEEIDHKDLHFVSCNCDCKRYPQLADRNKCTKCGHFHDIEPYIIVSRVDSARST